MKTTFRDTNKYTPKFLLWCLLWCLLMALPALLHAQDTGLDDLIRRAQAAGIEQSNLQQLQQRAGQQGLSNEELASLIEPAVSLAEQNLPSDAIFNKALEGLSKGVSPNRIMPVLQNLRDNTMRMAPVVDNWMGKPEVGNMLQQNEGMNRNAFRNEMIKSVSRGSSAEITSESISALLDEVGSDDVMNESTPQSIVAAVGIFAELPTSAQNPEMSRSLLIRSLKAGFSSSDLQKLPGAMSVAQQRSQLPAASVVQGVANQMRDGIPAQEILKNLFNGNVGGGPPGGIPPGLENKPDRGKNG